MSNPLSTAVDALRIWRLRARDRALLGQLSDRTLKDIGLNRSHATFEAAKPFWRR